MTYCLGFHVEAAVFENLELISVIKILTPIGVSTICYVVGVAIRKEISSVARVRYGKDTVGDSLCGSVLLRYDSPFFCYC